MRPGTETASVHRSLHVPRLPPPPPSLSLSLSPEGSSLPAALPQRNPRHSHQRCRLRLGAKSRCHPNASTEPPCCPPLAAMHDDGRLMDGGNGGGAEGCRGTRMHSEQISQRGARVEPLKDHLHEPWHGPAQRGLAGTVVVERGGASRTQPNPFSQPTKRSNR